jgi:hypothetical protein
VFGRRDAFHPAILKAAPSSALGRQRSRNGRAKAGKGGGQVGAGNDVSLGAGSGIDSLGSDCLAPAANRATQLGSSRVRELRTVVRWLTSVGTGYGRSVICSNVHPTKSNTATAIKKAITSRRVRQRTMDRSERRFGRFDAGVMQEHHRATCPRTTDAEHLAAAA